MTNESSFLNKVREALEVPQGIERSRSQYPGLFAKPDRSAAKAAISNRSYAEKERLIEVLRENCNALGITLHVVDSMKEAEDVTVEIIRSSEPEFSYNKHVIQHDHPDIAAMQLWKRFNRESVTLHTSYRDDRDVKEKTLASYIGITAPEITVAESGTLMQITGSGHPRSTSLVPSIHIALTRSEQLVADLEEGYSLLEELKPKDSFVFISGPSKTADIEAHLVHGAHGPKELHIILIKEAEPPVSPEPEPEIAGDEEESDTLGPADELKETAEESFEGNEKNPAAEDETSELHAVEEKG